MTDKNTNQIKGETPNFYPKLIDKDGNLINIGDVLYGEDGKAWKVDNILYSAEMSHPVGVWGVNEDGTPNYEYQAFTPKWLSRKNPKPEPLALDADALDEWMADIQCVISELPVGDYPLKNHLFDLQDKMRKVTEGESEADKWEDFI